MRSIIEGAVVLLLATTVVPSQEREFKLNIPVPARAAANESNYGPRHPVAQSYFNRRDYISFGASRELSGESKDPQNTVSRISVPFEPTKVKSNFSFVQEDPMLPTPVPQEFIDRGFNWRSAMTQSGLFLAIQHGFRFTEKKTRDELDGPFFRDWKESVENLRGWDDGGKFFTNYIGHPMQGAITGRIFVNNSGRARSQEFGKSKAYWKSRIKAMAWSAVWSTQFEIGPISEASLGNVGQKLTAEGRSKLTYVDFVMTPVGGTALLIAEDAVDKYLMKRRIERWTSNRLTIKILRSVLMPMSGFANILRGRAPWWRDDRNN